MNEQLISGGLSPTRNEFYTNFPFFKYWNKSENESFVRRDGINVYLHIPFCVQICNYCYYKKDILNNYQEIQEYVNLLCKEIKLVSEHFGLQNRPVDSVYIGGGTPSILKEPEFRQIFDTLVENHVVENPEFTFEVEPSAFSESKVRSYINAGVNRISMGVQSFDDEVIKISNRGHTSAKAIRMINFLKEFDINVNIDLLSGLAGDSLEKFANSVQTAIDLKVDMVTLYRMITYSNTVFYKEGVLKEKIPIPSDDEEADYFRHALREFLGNGYDTWSNYAFTNNGYQHTYSEKTWRGEDWVSYGVSSFGKIGNYNYQNFVNNKNYAENINSGKLPLYRTYRLTVKDHMVRDVLLATRLKSYTVNDFKHKFGFNYLDLIPETVDTLIYNGYIESDISEKVNFTEEGTVYGDYVSMLLANALKEKLGVDQIQFAY